MAAFQVNFLPFPVKTQTHMKTRNLLLALLFALPFTAMAGNVPDAVKQAFAKKYPAVAESAVKWESEGKNFEAEYKNAKGLEVSVLFAADGTLIETEEEIAVADLPAAIASHVSQNCATPVITKAEVIKDASGKVKNYEIEACGKEDWMFDASGAPTK